MKRMRRVPIDMHYLVFRIPREEVGNGGEI